MRLNMLQGIDNQSNFVAPPPGIDPGPWASKAHVLATTQWRNPYSLL